MKSKLLTTLLAIFAASSITAFATDEHHDAPTAGVAKTEKAEAVKTEKAETKKPVKRHNHMEEKTGMPMPAPAPDAGKNESMKMDGHEQMMKHDHMKEKR